MKAARRRRQWGGAPARELPDDPPHGPRCGPRSHGKSGRFSCRGRHAGLRIPFTRKHVVVIFRACGSLLAGVALSPMSLMLPSLLGTFKSSRCTLTKTDSRWYPVAVDPPLTGGFSGGGCVFRADFHGAPFRLLPVLPQGVC